MMFSYSSYNSFIIYNNLLVLFAILVINHFATVFDIRIVSYLLNTRVAIILECFLTTLCSYNIYKVTKHIINPFFSKLNVPFKLYTHQSGPLLNRLELVFKCLMDEWKSLKKPTTIQNPITTEVNNNKTEDKKFIELFTYKTKPTTSLNNRLYNQPKSTLLTNNPVTTTTSNPFNTKGFNLNEMQINQTGLNQLLQQKQNMMSSTVTNSTTGVMNASNLYSRTSASTKKPSETPKLQYVPCIRPPLKPTTHRERLLWFLSPTPEVVEDFKIEQMLDIQKYWTKFNDHASRIYYDKMTDILLSKILRPLSKSIEIYSHLLSPEGEGEKRLANCPAKAIALSLVLPNANDSEFSLYEIENFISLEGYLNLDGRLYIIERVKELAKNNRMAAYRFTPKYPGMPTDADIIMHVFKYYLSIREPYAIPPLLRPEGDLFKFLLIYIKITPELNHWKLFDEN
ncbi:uncharacterized protein BX663DRAFT_491038 [Cokeromyces recurvatus]|uniref:uncharacterized protein n=1 Tax=Cokeromyces recurvatus TaxID=90255 RepID=UPI00221EB703|nr:uncharacterized protein BX663DRAFT_491038 [Cokeromyces recurvatus]KAI7907475.1 hypothetical protein BX663DRAFT_491038 [Cokeromyces recurvatus]